MGASNEVIAEHVRLPPVEPLILIATTTGNVRRALRSEALPEALRGSKPLPPELAVPMLRRAIARITGLPIETVRRHVASMVERGILVSARGGVRAPNRFTEPWAAAAGTRFPALGASMQTVAIRCAGLEAEPAALSSA
jgi:hypothetical protein